MVYSYTFCNRTFQSDLHFAELDPSNQKDEIFSLRGSSEPFLTDQTIEWYHSWESTDSISGVHFGKIEDLHIIEVDGIGIFSFDTNNKILHTYSREGVSDELFRHIILHQIFPAILSLDRSLLILHGSAVEINERGIGFIGESGSGKSTLAAKLTKEGASLITDDILLLEKKDGQWLASPSYPSIRLWADSVGAVYGTTQNTEATTKQRIAKNCFGTFSKNPSIPLEELYILGANSTISPREILLELGCYSYRLDFKERESKAAEFNLLSSLVKEVPVKTISGYGDEPLINQLL